MALEIKCWQCDICKTTFLKYESALECEKLHAAEDNLEIAEIGLYEEGVRFPNKILIGDKSYSGVLAEYRLSFQSSVEDFYEKKEWGGEN